MNFNEFKTKIREEYPDMPMADIMRLDCLAWKNAIDVHADMPAEELENINVETLREMGREVIYDDLELYIENYSQFMNDWDCQSNYLN